MYRVRIKICGVTNIVDARMAEREGADAIGFVFWPQSPRALPVARVGEITRVLSPLTTKIGVFCDAGVAEVERTVRRSGLTGAQICGTPPGNGWRAIARRVRLIRVIPVDPKSPPKDPPWPFCYDYLFDTGTEELPGGTGEPFDWSLLPENKDAGWDRIYISGGLTSENVGELIKKYRPYAVDVSRTVEGESGRKDPRLVREFIAAVREAEYEVSESTATAEGNDNGPNETDGNAG